MTRTTANWSLLTIAIAPPGARAAFRVGLDDVFGRLKPWLRGDTLLNLQSTGDAARGEVSSAWTTPTWERLRRLKTEVDPGNLFRLNLNIPPV